MKICAILLLIAIAFGQESAYDAIVPEEVNDAAVMVRDDLPDPLAPTKATDKILSPPKIANVPNPNVPIDATRVKSTAQLVKGARTAASTSSAARMKEVKQLTTKGSPEMMKSVRPGMTAPLKKQLNAKIKSTAATLEGSRQQAFAQSKDFKKHAQEIRSKLAQHGAPASSIPSEKSQQPAGAPIAPPAISGVRQTAADIQAIKKRLGMVPQHSVSHSGSDKRAAKRKRRKAAKRRRKRRRKSDERAEKRDRKKAKKKARKEKAAKKRLEKKVKKEKKKAREKVAKTRKKVVERDHKKVRKAKKKAERRFKEKCAKARKKPA